MKKENEANQVESTEWLVNETPQDCGIVTTIGVTLWLGWHGILPWCFILITLFGTPFLRTVFVSLCILLISIPREFPGKIGVKLGDWLARKGASYFGLKTTLENPEKLQEIDVHKKATIFALEPHDMLPFPAVAFHPALGQIPTHTDNCVLVSSAIFKIPFIRQIFSWVRAKPVGKETFRFLLKNNHSFVFVPGGVKEVTFANSSNKNEINLCLQDRKGFIKLALEQGSPIVPAFAFHLDGCYGYWLPQGKWFAKLARLLGFVPLLFWGRFGIPFGIPIPKKIHVVVGSPIKIPCEGSNIKPESIQKYHGIFLRELEALYERHKDREGYTNRTLNIM